jgi:hypothetical protein
VNREKVECEDCENEAFLCPECRHPECCCVCVIIDTKPIKKTVFGFDPAAPNGDFGVKTYGESDEDGKLEIKEMEFLGERTDF